MRYWWVNQNQTYRSEVPGGFLWSPKRKSNGARNQFYDNMKMVQEGDVVFSFCDSQIKAIGIAVGTAETSSKPDFGNVAINWSNEGWYVPVEFKELRNKIYPKRYIDSIRPHLPEKYYPLDQSGNGLQSVYLAEVPKPMAETLSVLIGKEFTEILSSLSAGNYSSDSEAEHEIESISGRTDIGPTVIRQLIMARRGQGVFKSNVRQNEDKCRVTGIMEPAHLRASHIKPWRDSSDEEKLNGCNGLLLSPHIDHLFDKGYLSFSDDGELLISSKIDESLLSAWGISSTRNVGPFNPGQKVFLEHHRKFIFKP